MRGHGCRSSSRLPLDAVSPFLPDSRKWTRRRSALRGAEVDIARKGSSFDFQLSRAIGLALKPNAEHREQAMKAGIDAQACADIERLAASGTSRSLLRCAQAIDDLS